MLLFVKFLCQWSSYMQIHFEVIAWNKYNPISLMRMCNSAWEFKAWYSYYTAADLNHWDVLWRVWHNVGARRNSLQSIWEMCKCDLVKEHPESDGINYPHFSSTVPNINTKTLHPNHHGNSTSYSRSTNFSPDGSYREPDIMVLKYEGHAKQEQQGH